MEKLKVKELLKTLALIPFENWTVGNYEGCETIINNEKVEIAGDTEWGYSYYIKIEGKMVYRSDNPIWPPPFFPSIDSKLDSICSKIYNYCYDVKSVKANNIN